MLLIWAVRIQFFEAGGPRSLFSWWLEAEGRSLLLDAVAFLTQAFFLYLRSSNERLSPSHSPCLCPSLHLHLTRETRSLLLRGHGIRLFTWRIQNSLPISKSTTFITPAKSLSPCKVAYFLFTGSGDWGMDILGAFMLPTKSEVKGSQEAICLDFKFPLCTYYLGAMGKSPGAVSQLCHV